MISVRLALLLVAAACLPVRPAWAQGFTREAFVIELQDRAFGTRPVPVELWIPEAGMDRYPLVIVQHGSSRDGYRFQGGKGQTDTYSTRVMQAAVARGFAVAALDAFHEKDLTPSDKLKFPGADQYAVGLRRHLLAAYPRLDPRNTFYTGFSYGGEMVMGQMAGRNRAVWTALAPAEPGCNSFHKPRPLPYPVLVLKGSESHYYPRACQIAVQEHQKIGNRVELLMIPGANHYFSLNGQIVRGLAVNGCSDNPMIVDDVTGEMVFHDGTPTSREEFNRKCFRNEGGKGQTYERMDFAVGKVLDFFTANLRR
jgi:dienelactone hydrolase